MYSNSNKFESHSSWESFFTLWCLTFLDYIQTVKKLFPCFFKGTARRKKKVVHKTAATDDKKLQSNLKKLSTTNIPGIEEVRFQKERDSLW